MGQILADSDTLVVRPAGHTVPGGRRAATRGKRDYAASLLANPVAFRVLKPLFRGGSLICINYHRVAETVEHDRDLIAATPSQLQAQARWLKEHYRILDGAELEQFAEGRLRLRTPAVCLTFDDGYSDNFAAAEMLAGLGVPATFFITTGFVESGVIPPWDRIGYALARTTRAVVDVLAGSGERLRIEPAEYDAAMTRLMDCYRSLDVAARDEFLAAIEDACGVQAPPESGRNLFMTWAQIRRVAEMGHSIGGHTHSHPVLARLSRTEQRHEIGASREILEAKLQTPMRLFAYPFGKPGKTFSDVTRDVVREAGYKAAFSFYGGCNFVGQIDPYDVRRIKVERSTSLPLFRARVLTRGALGL